MPRVASKPLRQYPWIARLIFWAQKLKYGAPLEPSMAWGHSPNLLYGLQAFYRALDRSSSPLPRDLKALVSNLVSQLNHCVFCSDISHATLTRLRIPEEKILAVKDYLGNDAFTDKERAALSFAESMTDSTRRVTDEQFAALKQIFSEGEIVELTAWIAFQNMSSKFNSALDVPSQGFCQIGAR